MTLSRRTALAGIAGATLASTAILRTASADTSHTASKDNPMNALIVLTSISTFPASAGEHRGRATGFYIDEMAGPYWAMRDFGLGVEFASIAGGKPPIDPASLGEDGSRRDFVQRFLDNADSMEALATSMPITEADPSRYSAIFLPGGHGTMWDFRQSKVLADVIGTAWDNGAVVGAVCHGPAGLVEAVDASGEPIVKGRRVNAFTDAEEEAVGLTQAMPYLLESALREKGALFEGTDNFQPHAVRDGRLVTGQNPASVAAVSTLLVEALMATRHAKAA
ncbi:MAG: type 1 glutamine amidotransferase domain-containing protein [Devosia sp.]